MKCNPPNISAAISVRSLLQYRPVPIELARKVNETINTYQLFKQLFFQNKPFPEKCFLSVQKKLFEMISNFIIEKIQKRISNFLFFFEKLNLSQRSAHISNFQLLFRKIVLWPTFCAHFEFSNFFRKIVP